MCQTASDSRAEWFLRPHLDIDTTLADTQQLSRVSPQSGDQLQARGSPTSVPPADHLR